MTTEREPQGADQKAQPAPEPTVAFGYGRRYGDRARELGEFERHCGVRLPPDFVRSVGETCEGGFDGWYRVKTGAFGTIVWKHLLLMKLPDAGDREIESIVGQKEGTHITADLLDTRRSLFRSTDGTLRFLPFGAASCLRPEGRADEGFLAFDYANGGAVVFLREGVFEVIPIAETFTRMMAGAVLESGV